MKSKSKHAIFFLERRINEPKKRRETITEARTGRNLLTYRQETNIS